MAVAVAGHMQISTSPQTDNHASSFFTDRMPFLPPNQQHHSTESISTEGIVISTYRYKNHIHCKTASTETAQSEAKPESVMTLNLSMTELYYTHFTFLADV